MSPRVIVIVQRTFRWRQCVHHRGDRLLMPAITAKHWADRHVVMLSVKDPDSVQAHRVPTEDLLCLKKMERFNSCVLVAKLVLHCSRVVNTIGAVIIAKCQSLRVTVGLVLCSIEMIPARLNGRALIIRADSSRDL